MKERWNKGPVWWLLGQVYMEYKMAGPLRQQIISFIYV